MEKMSIAFICGISDEEKKMLLEINAQINRNTRRNIQAKPPIVDRENSDGTESDEYCIPKEEQETTKRMKKQTPKRKEKKAAKRVMKKQTSEKNPTSSDALQKEGEACFIFFAAVHNPQVQFNGDPEKSTGPYTVPSPVSMSENDD